jgi:aryl-alcohol dehydrogenase-like predicted oxidoreductase
MDITTLGKTGLKVSRIAFGTWQLGGDWGSFDTEPAAAAIRQARERGVTLFDTAQAYGFGASERLLGQALRHDLDHQRGDIVLATKGGLRITDSGLVRDASPQWLRQGVDDSLRALGVDYIDLYQVHWPDPAVPLADSAGALQELVDAGKIRHVGVSNFDVAQMEEFSRGRPVETVQPPYHLFHRDIEADILPYAQSHDIGVLVYGPLAHGLLSGTLTPSTTFPADDWRSKSREFQGAVFRRNLDVVDELARFARERGMTVSQLAIAWTLAHPAVQVSIVGTRNADHVAESVAAADIVLTAEDLATIDTIMAPAVRVAGPTPEGGG